MSEEKFEKYLRDNKPSEPDSDNFLLELSSRMSAVEGIKETVVKERRREKSRIVTALIVGFACGIGAEAIILLAQLPNFEIAAEYLLSLEKWEMPVPLIVAGSTMAISYLLSREKRSRFRWWS